MQIRNGVQREGLSDLPKDTQVVGVQDRLPALLRVLILTEVLFQKDSAVSFNIFLYNSCLCKVVQINTSAACLEFSICI